MESQPACLKPSKWAALVGLHPSDAVQRNDDTLMLESDPKMQSRFSLLIWRALPEGPRRPSRSSFRVCRDPGTKPSTEPMCELVITIQTARPVGGQPQPGR